MEEVKQKPRGEAVCGCDIWFEILSRLPTTTIVKTKCVCKDWRDHASLFLAQHRKMPFLSARGLLLAAYRDSGCDPFTKAKYESYLIYVSLTVKEISLRIDSPGGNIVNYGYNEQLLENLSPDFKSLYPGFVTNNVLFYTGHKGLILSVHLDGTYLVHNPATKQVLELPMPPYNRPFFSTNGLRWTYYNMIINLCSPLSSTDCSFVVLRFLKPHKLVDIYYPKTRKWVQCGFSLDYTLLNVEWYIGNCAFLCESQSLYFLTSAGQCVALQFESLDEPKICASYCFSLPEVVCDQYSLARLGESHGCLYLSHVDMKKNVRGMRIWKYCGVSLANPWILLFEVTKTTCLCKSVAKEVLIRFCRGRHRIMLMGFHPEATVVFIHVMPRLVMAYDFTNDTLDEIGWLDIGEHIRMTFVHSYSPCLASLGSLMK